MPIVNTNVTVLGSATVLVNADNGSPGIPIQATVYNPGVAAIFVGGAGVTATSGIPIAIGASKDFTLSTGNNLHAIVATATQTVVVFKTNS